MYILNYRYDDEGRPLVQKDSVADVQRFGLVIWNGLIECMCILPINSPNIDSPVDDGSNSTSSNNGRQLPPWHCSVVAAIVQILVQ